VFCGDGNLRLGVEFVRHVDYGRGLYSGTYRAVRTVDSIAIVA